MAYLMHVNGPALINYGVQNSLGSLIYLGETDDRVTLRFQEHEEDVHTDASGPTPADVQQWARICFISYRLVVWDNVVLGDFMSTKVGGRTYGHGTVAPPGLLLGQNGAMKTVQVASPYEGLPWRFLYCHLHGSQEIPLGTRRSAFEMTMRAIPGIGSNTDPAGLQSSGANALTLYTNT